MYERMGDDPVTGGVVGRLVAPDEGLESDTEAEAVAYDAGAGGRWGQRRGTRDARGPARRGRTGHGRLS